MACGAAARKVTAARMGDIVDIAIARARRQYVVDDVATVRLVDDAEAAVNAMTATDVGEAMTSLSIAIVALGDSEGIERKRLAATIAEMIMSLPKQP